MKISMMLFASGLMAAGLVAQDARPVHDDVGYCWNPAGMQKLVEYLEGQEKERFSGKGLVAAISPHDDYLYAGRVDYPLFRSLRAKEVVIFGVTHGAVRKEISGLDSVLILDEFKSWPGPRKPIAVSGLREYLKRRLDKSVFITSNKAHELEHSIEAMLPFLQYFNPEVKITPIMVAPMPFGRMDEVSTKLAGVIADYMTEKGLAAGKDIFFLISADGNHYGKDFNNLAFGEGEKAWEAAREPRPAPDPFLPDGRDGQREDRGADPGALGQDVPRLRQHLLVRQVFHPLRPPGRGEDRREDRSSEDQRDALPVLGHLQRRRPAAQGRPAWGRPRRSRSATGSASARSAITRSELTGGPRGMTRS